MIELLWSTEAWAALLTLTALEIVLGIDNVIFISVIVSNIPPEQAKRARQIGLALALIFRILLLSLPDREGLCIFVARHHPDRGRALSDRQGDP
jgi:predicted tellurium resistance membrane protein TerC